MDDTDKVGMHAIRDALETLVDPLVAARVLFAALDEPDAEVAGDAEGVMRFARGPLARVLSEEAGFEVVRSLLATLESLIEGDGEAPGVVWLEADTVTRTLEPVGGPVKVIIVAKSDRLATQLDLALGPTRVAAGVARDLISVSQLSGALAPDVIVVDGQSSPDVAAPELAATLGALKTDPLLIVWAADQPWGSAVVTAMKTHDVDCASIPRDEGVDPLLDYLRARMGAA
jgi:hypothetical protein